MNACKSGYLLPCRVAFIYFILICYVCIYCPKIVTQYLNKALLPGVDNNNEDHENHVASAILYTPPVDVIGNVL